MILRSILSKFSQLALNGPTSSRILSQTQAQLAPAKLFFSTSNSNKNLMEFFDTKENWKETEKIKHGRAWQMEELRLKDNGDLHKLWYVLHKERNMLLTMEEHYKKNFILFPSPERIAKVGLFRIFK